MKGIGKFGEYVLEVVVVTLLVALSVILVLPFVPMMVGLAGYFKNKKNVRLFRDIFVTIGENWKILIPYTIFELLITVFPILNIFYFNTHLDQMNYFILAISYVALVIGAIYFVSAPTIIVNMNVSFFQLLRNGFMLLFGGLLRSLASLAAVAGVIALILFYPYAVIASFYLLPMIVTKLMLENLYVLKARVLGTNVYTIKKAEQDDDYYTQKAPVQVKDPKGGNHDEA